MLTNDSITKLLGLQQILVDNLEENKENIFIFASSLKPTPFCECGKLCHIHDYRIQKIKAGKIRNKNIFILLKKRRFKCPIHNKIFTEQFNFIAKRHRILQRICLEILHSLHDVKSMTSIAKEFNVSTSTVCRYCDLLVSSKISDTPKMLAIDEFKGNTGGFKYNAIITDPSSKRVIDILKTRDEEYLKTYFKSLKNPENLEYFLQDMWKPFKNFAQSTFKNAKIVADKYHFVRQVIWALERVRKREQRRLSKKERLFFKRSKSLLLKDYKQLSLEEDLYLHNMFSHSYDLEKAYELTKAFKDFQRAKDYQTAKKELLIWIGMAKESKLEEFKDAITALTNWREEICNSKLIQETNGFTEGCNNKIKVLKRNAYGFRNFERFRKRILHIFNKTPHLATSC